MAAAPNLLLGKALVGSGFLVGASAGSKGVLLIFITHDFIFRTSSATAARLTQS